MKCPHCNVGINLEIKQITTYELPEVINDKKTGIELSHGFCPECNGLIVILKEGEYKFIEGEGEIVTIEQESFLYPKFYKRIIDTLVPDYYRSCFNEANDVLSVSPKASAALSRRLLQTTLRDEYQIIIDNLAKQIDQFINLPSTPSYISEAIDAIRKVGNFAAHPNKYTHTDEIVEVEHKEAEWILDVLEEILDFTFVQPKQRQARITKLNQKLAALGDKPMK